MRKSIPKSTEAEVLFLNRHICCICHDKNKDVQIHHLDGNNSNNKINNLVVLCLDCHSKVTGTRGLGKTYSMSEVKRYKRDWEFFVKNEYGLSYRPKKNFSDPNPPDINSYFAGRKKEIELFSKVLDNNQNKVDIIWIWGPSGIGKTDLKLKFSVIAEERGFEYKGAIIGKGEVVTAALSRAFGIISPLSQFPDKYEDIKFRTLAEVENKLSTQNKNFVIAVETAKEFEDYEGIKEYYIKYLYDSLRKLKNKTILIIITQNEPPFFTNTNIIKIKLQGLTTEEIRELIGIKPWDKRLLEYIDKLKQLTDGNPSKIIDICDRPDPINYLVN